ncbi:MAG: NADH-quinone oxidoreductase subunit NuoK [Candidatus Odinarchaeota archaeon]
MALETISDFEVVVVLSLVMLLIGIYGFIAKRNAIKVIMALEILVSAPNLAFIAFGYARDDAVGVDPLAQAFIIIALAVGAAVIGLALAFMRNLWRHFGTTEVDAFTTLKG